MHACGHEANTAVMLGVAKKIVDTGLMSRGRGAVKLIFQPAEEQLGGAKALIAAGVLEDPPVDLILSGHMSPDLPVGRAGVFKRLGYASSDRFVLDIQGGRARRAARGVYRSRGRRGSFRDAAPIHRQPQRQADGCRRGHGRALLRGERCQRHPRNRRPGGKHPALSPEVRAAVVHRIGELAASLQTAFGVIVRFAVHPGAPVLLNTPRRPPCCCRPRRRCSGRRTRAICRRSWRPMISRSSQSSDPGRSCAGLQQPRERHHAQAAFAAVRHRRGRLRDRREHFYEAVSRYLETQPTRTSRRKPR